MKDEPGRKSQRERFAEAARAIEADDSPDALDRAFGKLDLARKPNPSDFAEADERCQDERHDPDEDASGRSDR